MPSELLDELAPSLATFAAENGLKVDQEVRADSFDNAFVALGSPVIRLRVVRYKGDVMVDAGPPGTETWHQLERLIAFIDPSVPASPPPNLVKLIDLLDRNLEEIRSVFESPSRWEAFLRYDRALTAETIQDLFNGSAERPS
jgi:hypothetical protein